MSYWDATERHLQNHGAPDCPSCGSKMVPQDDHGRFTCFFCPGDSFDVVSGTTLRPPEIPQVDTADMPDDQKAKIPPLHRLHDAPTEAESRLLQLLIDDDLESGEFALAQKAVEKERGE